MAEIPLPDNAGERYTALEQAYVEERWAGVVAPGQALLEELEDSNDPQAESLANRVRVLIGHTHLYGLLDSDAAVDYYRDVLTSRAEPELRRIATEGLRQCQRPPAPEARPEQAAAASGPGSTSPGTATGPNRTDPFLAAVSAAPVADAGSTAAVGPAMPWLKDLAAGGGNAAAQPLRPAAVAVEAVGSLAPRLEVDVVEEPELVEVAQADPELSQELELELSRIRERRAARAAAERPARPSLLKAEEQPASNDPGDPLAAAIATATAKITAMALVDDPREGPLQPPQPEASGGDAMTRPRRAADSSRQPARAEAAGDLSGEDPDLVAGLLAVVLRD